MAYPSITIRLPNWVEAYLFASQRPFATVEERMGLVIALSRLNVSHGTGGPFAAAVFEQQSGRLLAPGVNRVMATNCSSAHAEIIALSIAQQVLGRYDIGRGGAEPFDLVTSTEPCAMCLGAIPWSGVTRLVCGARDEDARRIGFDEGHKPENWAEGFESRGISVLRDVLRAEAASVLRDYEKRGGVVY